MTWYVCSSAGGGLRLAVVGYEPLVTARGRAPGRAVGRRPGGARGGRAARPAPAWPRCGRPRPDVVLLVGGTDGGDADVLPHNAARLARARLARAGGGGRQRRRPRRGGWAAARARGVPVTATDNVLPRIGVLDPGAGAGGDPGGVPAPRHRRQAAVPRAAVRVAGAGGHPRRGADRCGAARRPHSAATCSWSTSAGPPPTCTRCSPPTGRTGPRAEVAGTLWRARTVEGDLGMRWSAPGVVAAARLEKLDLPAALAAAAARGRRTRRSCRRRPSGVDRRSPPSPRRWRCAGTPAANRERAGRDLRDVRLLWAPGVSRHAPAGRPRRCSRRCSAITPAGGRCRGAPRGGRRRLRAGRRRSARLRTPDIAGELLRRNSTPMWLRSDDLLRARSLSGRSNDVGTTRRPDTPRRR